MSEKKINGRTFRVAPMLATKALVLQAKLFRIAGPAIARLPEIMAGYGTATEEQKAHSNSAAISSFAAIFAESEPEELATIIKEVCELSQIQRTSGAYDKLDYDGDMTGHGADIIPLTVFILQEQFGDFFSGIPGLGSQSILAQR